VTKKDKPNTTQRLRWIEHRLERMRDQLNGASICAEASAEEPASEGFALPATLAIVGGCVSDLGRLLADLAAVVDSLPASRGAEDRGTPQ
jgi:hypothetical protein